jgi:hypothetical protein
MHRSNSSGTNTHILINPCRYESGDRVQATQTVNSPDNAVLSFQKGDFIEILRENEDGSLTVCLILNHIIELFRNPLRLT